MILIPAIDIIDGKCVRLRKGDYRQAKVYNETPLEVAKQFADVGLTHLHLVDLDGAKAGKIINWSVLEQICTQTSLIVDFGGGIKQDEDLRIAFESGATAVNVGSTAIKRPKAFIAWLEAYGPEAILLSADVRKGHIAIHGWQDDTEVEVVAFIQSFLSHGLKRVVCTDISKDGMLEGPGFDLYRKVLTEVNDIELVASGGVKSMVDLEQLDRLGLHAAIIGKAIYEGYIKLDDLAQYHAA